LNEIFEPCDSIWRGLGNVPGSGLKVRDKYEGYDAWKVFGVSQLDGAEPKGCRCGEVLKGIIIPDECSLFGKICTPESPVGACMVSSEGTCAAYFRYGRG
jgi:hydrogenase expression/formation protein HypD